MATLGCYSRIAPRESVVNWPMTIHSGISTSHAPCLSCLIDTISCLNRCMLTLYCLIGHSIVISRGPTMKYTGTGNWQAPSLTYRFCNRNLGRIVPARRLTDIYIYHFYVLVSFQLSKIFQSQLSLTKWKFFRQRDISVSVKVNHTDET